MYDHVIWPEQFDPRHSAIYALRGGSGVNTDPVAVLDQIAEIDETVID